MDKILIQNLRTKGILGVHEWERRTPREIVVAVTLFTDTSRAAASDDLADCVNYSSVSEEILTLVGTAQRFTLEALSEDIANLCLSRLGVQKVIVRVDKPGAVENADTVGVEIERTN
jgi:7,8-dihydroneopterin aldolase/epimerase/oxygenase